MGNVRNFCKYLKTRDIIYSCSFYGDSSWPMLLQYVFKILSKLFCIICPPYIPLLKIAPFRDDFQISSDYFSRPKNQFFRPAQIRTRYLKIAKICCDMLRINQNYSDDLVISLMVVVNFIYTPLNRLIAPTARTIMCF